MSEQRELIARCEGCEATAAEHTGNPRRVYAALPIDWVGWGISQQHPQDGKNPRMAFWCQTCKRDRLRMRRILLPEAP